MKKVNNEVEVVALMVVALCAWTMTISLQSVVLVVARPPESPVQCGRAGDRDCVIKSTYGVWPDREDCVAAAAAFPTSERELVDAVASAVRDGRKVKVVSPWAHSIPKLACPGSDDGLVISTARYNARVAVDAGRRTAEAEAGVDLRQLVDAAARYGLALPYMPYWGGVSIAGLISTGAHGSSLFRKGGAVHEYVLALRLVVPAPAADGYARVLVLNSSWPDEFDAAKVALGVLGAISTVTLQLEPMFKRSITNDKEHDDGMEDRILEFGLTHEFGDLTWHPAQGHVVYRKDFRVPDDTDGDGVSDFIGFEPILPIVAETVRGLETALEKTGNADGKCGVSGLQVASLSALGTGLKNNELFFARYPVIGFHNRLVPSSNCLVTDDDDERVCAWDNRIHGLFFHQTTVSIDIDRLPGFIRDVKALRKARGPSSLCNSDLYYGIIMRFVRNSTAFLGEEHDAVSVDITYYRSRHPSTPRLNEDVWEEIEQMAVFKYKGRPHWGKNRPVAFIDVASKYPNVDRFIAVKRRFDPQGLFSSDWSDAMLGLGPLPLSQAPGCALEGLCICSTDAHCAPDLGYRCRRGLVYRDARVCRKVSDDDDDAACGNADDPQTCKADL